MSNRTRIILTSPNEGVFYGALACKHILTTSRPPYLPMNWSTLPSWKKYMYLAQYLPRPMKCQVFREPRRTKASRSLYWKALQALGVMPPAPRRRREPRPKVLARRAPAPPGQRVGADPFLAPGEIQLPAAPGPAFGNLAEWQPIPANALDLADLLLRRY